MEPNSIVIVSLHTPQGKSVGRIRWKCPLPESRCAASI